MVCLLESKSSRLGVKIIILLIGIAVFIKTLASLESLRSIYSFAGVNPEGGILIWDLPGHLWSTVVLICLLIAVIVIHGRSRKIKKVSIPLVLVIAIAAPTALIYYGDDLKYRATNIIQDQGMQLCKEEVVGRGKYSRQTLEFKPICS